MTEHTLDPDDWEDLRKLGHQMVDDLLEYLKSVGEREVWKPIPHDTKRAIFEPLPAESQPREEIYEQFKELILPYPPGNIHPRFWGWVNGTGSPFGMLAEMAAAAMNANTGGREHMPKYVEEAVINWFKEIMGFPHSSSGIMTSGCSEANLIALAIARNTQAGWDVREKGLSENPCLLFYGSVAMHSSIQKALEIIGIGRENLRCIEVDDEFQIRTDVLEESIQKDIAEGNKPVCIIGNVGTVNTGAVDNLEELHRIARKYNLWFHVDGAFGALAILSEKYGHLVKSVRLADSLAFDGHKWLSMPYTVGFILVKDENKHRGTFSLRPSYLAQIQKGIGSGGRWPTEYGIQLSRTFYALKVWFMLKENGTVKYGKVIEQNMEQARYLAQLINEHPDLELLAPIHLNVVCFRFSRGNDDVNKQIMMILHEEGIAAPSSTSINGKFALRTAITNHRSRYEDFDILVDNVVRIGNSLV